VRVSDRRSTKGASSHVLAWESSDEQILVTRFASLVEQAVGTRDVPNVWVLDTFEVAQRQAPTAIDRLWSFLDRLQGACPRLRVVLCGRAPVSDHATVDLPLGELDPVAAAEMLRQQLDGLDLPKVFLRRIVTAVSAQPVSLRIAVLYIRAAATGGASSFDTAEKRRDLLLSLSASEVEGVLYRRILDHVEDDDVRRIAHPGLALRRVTPEAIQAILARPCGLGRVDRAQAQHLFYALSRELSLVEPDSSEGLRATTRRCWRACGGPHCATTASRIPFRPGLRSCTTGSSWGSPRRCWTGPSTPRRAGSSTRLWRSTRRRARSTWRTSLA